MGFFDWVDEEGAGRAADLEELENSEVAAETPTVTPGETLPRTNGKSDGGTKYSAAVTPSGRVHTEQLIEQKNSGSPLADISRDVLSQKSYAKDRDDSDFVKAPTIGRAYGIDKSRPGWGGFLTDALSRWGKSAASTAAGGMMGGKKGALEAWQGNASDRQDMAAQRQKQLSNVSSDKTMREAYEMARMNYESDYNSGKSDIPFGDYLAQALEAMGSNGSGNLRALMEEYGSDEGYRKWIASKSRGGSGSSYETREGIDRDTGEFVRRRGPVTNKPLDPTVSVSDKDGYQTIRSKVGRPNLSEFDR